MISNLLVILYITIYTYVLICTYVLCAETNPALGQLPWCRLQWSMLSSFAQEIRVRLQKPGRGQNLWKFAVSLEFLFF